MSETSNESPTQRRYRDDAEVLAGIGRALSRQHTRVTVQIPQPLADLAAAAWDREEYEDAPSSETPEQRWYRDRAAELALIGLAIRDRGSSSEHGVVVDIDAVELAGALEASEQLHSGQVDAGA